MGRLKEELIVRTEVFADRMLNVVQALEKNRVYSRIIDQIVGSGTSVGANAAESDQAVSAKDFCKSLGIVLKELGESRYWLRMCGQRKWLTARSLNDLHDESLELSRIFGVDGFSNTAQGIGVEVMTTLAVRCSLFVVR